MKGVSQPMKSGERDGFLASIGKRFGAKKRVHVSDCLVNDVVSGKYEKCVTSVYVSTPLECKAAGGWMGEHLRNSYGRFRLMPVANLPRVMARKDTSASSVGGMVVKLGSSYGVVIQLQRGAVQVAVVVPLGIPGMHDYIKESLSSGVMPLAGWCEAEGVDGVIALPPLSCESANLLHDLKVTKQPQQEMFECMASLSRGLCRGEAESLLEGVPLERLMVTCVSPAG